MRSVIELMRLGCRRDLILRDIKEKEGGPGLGFMSPARSRAMKIEGCRDCMRRGLIRELLRNAADGKVLR